MNFFFRLDDYTEYTFTSSKLSNQNLNILYTREMEEISMRNSKRTLNNGGSFSRVSRWIILNFEAILSAIRGDNICNGKQYGADF